MRAKERYDALVKEDPLVMNDWVLMKRGCVMSQGRAPKFVSNWVGPYKVLEVHEYGTYKLQAPDGMIKEDLVHRDRLKRCRIDPQSPPTAFWSDEVLDEYDRPEDFIFPFPDAVLNSALQLGAFDNLPVTLEELSCAIGTAPQVT